MRSPAPGAMFGVVRDGWAAQSLRRRWLAPLALVALGLCPAAGYADCLDRLAAGASAQRAGQMAQAEQIFRDALAVEVCRVPPHAPLLRFSLGGILASPRPDGAPSTRPCEAAEQFALARSSAVDAEVAEAARVRLFEAQGQCQAQRAAKRPPPDGGRPPPAVAALPPAPREVPVAQAGARTPTPREPAASAPGAPNHVAGAPTARGPADHPPTPLALGPRVQSGISGLAFGRFTTGDVTPGATLGLGLALQYRASPRLHLWLDPGITMTSLRYTHREGPDAQSAVWRWIIVDAVAGVGWHPLGEGLALLLGAGGGWVLDASEKSGLIAEDGAAITGARLLVDAVVGAAYAWDVTDGRLRATLTGGLGLMRLNPEADRAGWHGYRLSLGLAALF